MTMPKMKYVMPSVKTPIPRMLQSNVVYKIQCPGCASSYVGQTIRHLKQRFGEHVGETGGPVKAHLQECNISPEDYIVRIIGKARTLPKLLTLEALFIHQQKPSLNAKVEYKRKVLTLKFL